jgi:DNA-binding transcriptional ArsR family regulator
MTAANNTLDKFKGILDRKDMMIVSVIYPQENVLLGDNIVQEISKFIGDHVEQSLLSHHLIKMKDKGILDCHKDGQFVYYKLQLREVLSLLDCMEKCKAR